MGLCVFFLGRVKKNGEKVSMFNNCDNIAWNHVFFLLETNGPELSIEKPTLFYLDPCQGILLLRFK